MSASLSGLSASVTRILSLTGFPKELKTKDIQAAFSEWEGANGGFKIKWQNDTSLLIVFQDPVIAKRAYLSSLANPPAVLSPQGHEETVIIRPYDGADAQEVIQNVNARGMHNHNASRGHNMRSASISGFPTRPNGNNPGGRSNANNHNMNGRYGQTQGVAEDREPSPTLPSLPTHPTLNSLISSTLGENVGEDPAILAAGPSIVSPETGGPRIGNPGKRMLGAALGVRHPSLGPRQIGNNSGANSPGVDYMTRAMGGLAVAE